MEHSLQELTFLSMHGHVALLSIQLRELLDPSVAKWAMAETEGPCELYVGRVVMPLCSDTDGDMLGSVIEDKDGTSAAQYWNDRQQVMLASIVGTVIDLGCLQQWNTTFVTNLYLLCSQRTISHYMYTFPMFLINPFWYTRAGLDVKLYSLYNCTSTHSNFFE